MLSILYCRRLFVSAPVGNGHRLYLGLAGRGRDQNAIQAVGLVHVRRSQNAVAIGFQTGGTRNAGGWNGWI